MKVKIWPHDPSNLTPGVYLSNFWKQLSSLKPCGYIELWPPAKVGQIVSTQVFPLSSPASPPALSFSPRWPDWASPGQGWHSLGHPVGARLCKQDLHWSQAWCVARCDTTRKPQWRTQRWFRSGHTYLWCWPFTGMEETRGKIIKCVWINDKIMVQIWYHL